MKTWMDRRLQAMIGSLQVRRARRRMRRWRMMRLTSRTTTLHKIRTWLMSRISSRKLLSISILRRKRTWNPRIRSSTWRMHRRTRLWILMIFSISRVKSLIWKHSWRKTRIWLRMTRPWVIKIPHLRATRRISLRRLLLFRLGTVNRQSSSYYRRRS